MPAAAAQLHSFISPETSGASRTGHRSLLARFFASLHEARSRQAEREIAHLIEIKGGRLSDDIERQIERHFI